MTTIKRDLNGGVLEERYFARMASSIGDKYRLINFLPTVEEVYHPRVLDVGAGGGEFSNLLFDLGYDVIALDASADAIKRMSELYPNLTLVEALANHGSDVIEPGSLDVIICSSILHEVFSYGDDFHRSGHVSSLSRAFEDFNKLLRPGGKLIIRDGVLPENWEDEGTITILNPTDVPAVTTYLGMCPFANGVSYGESGHLVQLEQINENTFKGNARSLLEFSYTFNWGVENYPREALELYAVKTLQGYTDFITDHGFIVIHTESYLQEGYPEHLNPKVTLKINGVENNWFDTNAIWVAVKE
jgi:SAM-dependent methyltransferase